MSTKPRCIWLWGPTGCGKNKWIIDHFGDVGVYPKSYDIWWGFYNGEEVVTIDNMHSRSKFVPTIIKIAKCVYPKLKIKGGYVDRNYKWIFITSIYSLDDCLKNSKYLDEMKQLFEVYHYDEIDSLNIN